MAIVIGFWSFGNTLHLINSGTTSDKLRTVNNLFFFKGTKTNPGNKELDSFITLKNKNVVSTKSIVIKTQLMLYIILNTIIVSNYFKCSSCELQTNYPHTQSCTLYSHIVSQPKKKKNFFKNLGLGTTCFSFLQNCLILWNDQMNFLLPLHLLYRTQERKKEV